MNTIEDVVKSLKEIHPNCHIESALENVTYDGYDEYGPEIENRSLQIILYDPSQKSYRIYNYESSIVIGNEEIEFYLLE